MGPSFNKLETTTAAHQNWPFASSFRSVWSIILRPLWYNTKHFNEGLDVQRRFLILCCYRSARVIILCIINGLICENVCKNSGSAQKHWWSSRVTHLLHFRISHNLCTSPSVICILTTFSRAKVISKPISTDAAGSDAEFVNRWVTGWREDDCSVKFKLSLSRPRLFGPSEPVTVMDLLWARGIIRPRCQPRRVTESLKDGGVEGRWGDLTRCSRF